MDSGVQVVEPSFVTPSEALPRKGLWLSSMDLALANRGHTPTVYFYSRSDDATANFFDVPRLKKAMAKALVSFYPLAGRLSVDDDGRLEINCNSEGALFVVARSDLTVEDFSDFRPSAELRRLFVPRIEPPSIMLAVQVTFLKCGGVALGTALHHVVIDAISAFHFFQTWSAFCRDGDGAVVELPCHDRTLLRARSPPVVHPGTMSVFCPTLTLSEPSGLVVSEVFAISKDQLAALKRLCGGASTFCAVSAHVWQCMCVARRVPPDAKARLTFPANFRRAIMPSLPDRYFGNACIWLSTTSTASDITSSTLADVAGQIRGAIRKMDDELVRSAVDYFELAERDARPLKGSMSEAEIRVISWLGMPVYDADFGWGKPQVMSRAESVRGGLVYLMNGGPADNGSVRVLMCMEDANLREFESLLYAKF